MSQRNYIITCVSGTCALVRAADEDAANRKWDEWVRRGDAEERISGMTDRASRAEVAFCVAMGHDYR